MKKIFIFIITVLFLFSCNPDRKCKLPEQDIETGMIVSNALVSHPLITGEMRDKEHIIRSDSENIYSLQVSFDEGKSFQNIDFSQYTLLGKRASGQCHVHFERDVSVNVEQKQVLYIIRIRQCGTCKKFLELMNWVLIPKIPDDYNVTFKVEETKE